VRLWHDDGARRGRRAQHLGGEKADWIAQGLRVDGAHHCALGALQYRGGHAGQRHDVALFEPHNGRGVQRALVVLLEAPQGEVCEDLPLGLGGRNGTGRWLRLRGRNGRGQGLTLPLGLPAHKRKGATRLCDIELIACLRLNGGRGGWRWRWRREGGVREEGGGARAAGARGNTKAKLQNNFAVEIRTRSRYKKQNKKGAERCFDA
jgi:hypothetical protein